MGNFDHLDTFDPKLTGRGQAKANLRLELDPQNNWRPHFQVLLALRSRAGGGGGGGGAIQKYNNLDWAGF